VSSILDKAAPPVNEALIVTVCGTPGSGKTSMACSWPSPYLIRTQGEAIPRDIPKHQTPVSIGETASSEVLFEQLLALAREEHGFKTVIIDSVTGLEQMFVNEVLASDPKAKAIQQAGGGYGAGRDAVAAMHSRVRKAAEVLRKRGINVVFLAHSDVVQISPPDSEAYSQYSLRLHGKSMAFYVDSVDVVGFLRQSTALVGEEGRKRAIGGERVLVTYLTPSSVSKNRLGITEEIPVEQGKNPLTQWVLGDAPQPKSAKKGAAHVSVGHSQDAERIPSELADEVDPADYAE